MIFLMVTLCTYIMCVTPLLSLSCAQHVVYCVYKNVSIASEIGYIGYSVLGLCISHSH